MTYTITHNLLPCLSVVECYLKNSYHTLLLLIQVLTKKTKEARFFNYFDFYSFKISLFSTFFHLLFNNYFTFFHTQLIFHLFFQFLVVFKVLNIISIVEKLFLFKVSALKISINQICVLND